VALRCNRSEQALESGKKLDGDALFFDPRRHGEALALLASQHLDRGNFATAFRYADRRCRLFKPGARDLLLRSEASRGDGHAEEAAEDLTRALEIDPTDRLVKKLALRWGTAEQKQAVARDIVADPALDRALLHTAVAALFEGGAKILFSLRRKNGNLAGWVAWTEKAQLSVLVHCNDAQKFDVAPDPDHWLAGAARSCAEIEAPDEEGALRGLDFLIDGAEAERFAPPPAFAFPQDHGARARPEARGDEAPLLTVITPVYEDFDATRACLDALCAEGSAFVARKIVVDDASPNPQLRDWLDAQAEAGRFELIRNEHNLGFAVSVNKALALCSHGDVLLLNADALPPPSSLDRLAAIAHSAPDIGTVTPLSNNGEFTSFPAPNVVNPLGAPMEVARLDALARRANGAAAVDLPNGIGFCLYITRACLDAVGPLPEIYARGYYEDVEFCLRAREQGFRNVCAVGVYVGHAGARSFGVTKRRLVMRNLATLERRFPGHSLECAAFLRADPLNPARSAIEALTPPETEAALLVCREGASALLAREEAQRMARDQSEPAPVICQWSPVSNSVLLRGEGDQPPQSLQFSLRDAKQPAALQAWLAAANWRRIDLFDPIALPESLLKMIFRLRRRVELVVGDFEWAFPSRLPVEGPCREPAAPGPCEACAGALAPGDAYRNHAARLKRRRALLARAREIRPLDRMSEAFARHIFADAPVAAAPVPAPGVRARQSRIGEGALAFIAPAPCALADRTIFALGRSLLRLGDATPIVVFGDCLDDLATMSPGNVFVAGKVESDEYARLFRQYEVSALMSPYRTRFFGRLDVLAEQWGLPKAYFDWSFGKMPLSRGDLALDPRLCDAKAATSVAAWLSSGRSGGEPRGSDRS
jgi:GT2 family glycosyltransferase